MEKIFALSSIALLLMAGCDFLSESDIRQGDFFPLRIGQQWTYRITESDIDTSRLGFPKQFTVSVVDEVILADEKYFLMANYFVPGPTLPETILVRSTGSQVFIRFDPEQEEYLFYSFTRADTMWSVPMYANPSTLYPRTARLEALAENTATIAWDWNGRSESGWQEIFERKVGRKEIVSVSQVYGKIVWKLESTK